MTESQVHAFLAEKAEKTERAMDRYLSQWTGAPEQLRDAMRYSVFAGGKRLRPALALGAAEIVSGSDAAALPAACALEMIHTYSLIHDDLPAMDNDDLRRGKPTLHRVFGEATAILAGDGLLTMAFDVAAETGNVAVIRELAQAAGVEGMVGGQQLDMEGESKTLTLEEIRRIHACKTGALIRAAVRMGGLLGGADAGAMHCLTQYGEKIGLAFQIADDILNVVGTEEVIGKPVGSDAEQGKSTYPALLGLAQARALAVETAEAAIAALDVFGAPAESFRALARYIVERDK